MHVESGIFYPTIQVRNQSPQVLVDCDKGQSDGLNPAWPNIQNIYDLSKWKAAWSANVGKSVSPKAVSKGRLFPSA
ncbi:MAG: hypothetical protein JWN25_1952 [Verrucomicrobiales bacterium]|nr:hypothetical protein [Verrucomicrobiales bacterium]MDB6130613.1 hypothetical protein [Verrucomicrobiales bacterium]